jgi:hypothetical protein
MVRNLVLTPFIDLAFAHFMFSGEKIPEFFNLPDSQPTGCNSDCIDQLFPIGADKPIDGTSLKGSPHD